MEDLVELHIGLPTASPPKPTEEFSVEVDIGNGAYYPAIVTDVLLDGVLVEFENNWRPKSMFPFSKVFLPPKATKKYKFAVNQEVEIYTKSDVGIEAECGWWTANVRVSGGEILTIELQRKDKFPEGESPIWRLTFKEMLRPKKPRTPINKNTFTKCILPAALQNIKI